MLELIPILIGVLMGIIVIANVVIGVLAGFKKSIACMIAVVAAALVSGGLTYLAFSPSINFIPWVMGFVVDWLSSLNAVLGELLAIEPLLEVLTGYFSMIVAPFFFMIVFIVVAIIFTIIFTVIAKRIPVLCTRPKPTKKRPKAAEAKEGQKYCSPVLHRLGGVGIGLVTGLLVAILCVFPIVGVGDMACDTLALVARGALELAEVDSEVIDQYLPENVDINNLPDTMKVYDYVGCTYLYDTFATTEIDGEKIVLREEYDAILGILSDALEIVSLGDEIDDRHVEALRSAVENLDRAESLKYGLVGTLKELYNAGEFDFNEMLGSNEIIAPVVDKIVSIASTADRENITGDLDTLVNVADVLVKYEVLGESDYKAMLKKFGDGAVAELLVAVNENQRMRPVADEINLLSVRALAAAIGVPESAEERYDLLMNEIAYVIKVSYGVEDSERVAQIMPELKLVFEKYGMDIDGLALEHVAEGLVADLGGLEVVNGSDVKEFFALYDIAAKEESDSSAKGSGKLENLSENSDVVVNADGSISINGVVFNNYNANNYKNSAAYHMGHDHVDIGLASTLGSADYMQSTLLTVEDVLLDIGHYDDCSDVNRESEKVGEIFSAMLDIVADSDFNDLDPTVFIGEVGHALDLMKSSEIFGSDAAEDILKMVLQSETMIDALGLTRSDMTAFADKINGYAANKDMGYEEATKAIANTVGAITKATDSEASAAEKVKATADMINSLNKENAEMVTSMVTGDMIGNFGGSVDNSTEVSDSLKNLIHNMADYKTENSDDDEAIDKEAEAVTKILSLAIVGSNDVPLFDKKDESGDVIEKGAVGSDAEDFIATVVESSVVMGTVSSTCDGKELGDNPYGISYDSDEEKADVVSALENYYDENKNSDPDLESKIMDIALVMDVEVDLSQYKN